MDKIIKGDIYYTFGIFCSFECALAYIQDNMKFSHLFEDSDILLHNMRFDMYGKKNKIIRALDYTLLDTYDPNGMNINEWRNNRKQIIEDTNQIIKSVKQMPVGKLMSVGMRF